MDKHKVTISKHHEFSTQDINDLMVTALEGGINYWCGNVRILRENNKITGVSDENQAKVEFASDAIGYGGSLVLTDIEDPEEKWVLNLEKMLKGIGMYCEKHNVPLDELMDEHDAEVADCIVQYALFDEITFG